MIAIYLTPTAASSNQYYVLREVRPVEWSSSLQTPSRTEPIPSTSECVLCPIDIPILAHISQNVKEII